MYSCDYNNDVQLSSYIITCIYKCNYSKLLQGLGKRKLIDKDVDQHLSNDLISWREPSAKSMSSSKPTSLSMYQPFTDTSAILNTFTASNDLLSKYQIFTKGHFHRYPHKHNLVSNPSTIRPVPLTTDWGVDPVVTPFWVMATTQKPFITRNNWKYSYNRFR